jgi:hypothetical protein
LIEFYPKELIIPNPQKIPQEKTKDELKVFQEENEKKKRYWALLFFIGVFIFYNIQD